MCNCDTEIWKDIKDFEGYYQISNLGNLRSIRSCHGNYQEKLRKPFKRKEGYVSTNLYKDKVNTYKLIHRLVAETFIKNPEDKATVNHIDGDKSNNCLCNLEWATPAENIAHAFDTGLATGDAFTKRVKGVKRKAATSKFHNVYLHAATGRWRAAIKIDKKQVGHKYFDTELEAAKHVNHLLTLHNITDRPFNKV